MYLLNNTFLFLDLCFRFTFRGVWSLIRKIVFFSSHTRIWNRNKFQSWKYKNLQISQESPSAVDNFKDSSVHKFALKNTLFAVPWVIRNVLLYTVTKAIIKMKISSGKLQFWGWKSPLFVPVRVADSFVKSCYSVCTHNALYSVSEKIFRMRNHAKYSVTQGLWLSLFPLS
jgi:hypothetical protein